MRANTVVEISVQRMVCTACGSEANASCNCGKPYVPAKQRAADEAKKDPSASVRTIAERAGVGVATAHEALAGVRERTPGSVKGRDGKVYRLPSREKEQSPQSEARESFLTLVDLSMRIADVDLSLIAGNSELKKAAHTVIEAWSTAEGKL